MDIKDIFVRAFGILGLVLTVYSYQMKTRKGILAMQIASTCCFCIQFTLLFAVTGAVMNFIDLARTITYYFKGKNAFFKGYYLPAIMTAISVAVCAWTYTQEGVLAILPGIGMVCTSISLWLTKPMLVRIISFPSSPVWLVYNAVTGSYEGVITEVFCMISIIIGVLRHDIDWSRVRKKKHL